jgi:hypothetical protein
MEADMITVIRGWQTMPWREMSWSAIVAGTLASLVIQILLTLLGIGVGLWAANTWSAPNSPMGMTWLAFAWWTFSGIFAAFVGGWVASAAATSSIAGTAHAMVAWALAVVIVTGAAGLAAGSAANIIGNLAGPASVSMARLATMPIDQTPPRTVGRSTAAAPPPTEELTAARRAVAASALASFFALLIGACAAYLGGRSEEAHEPMQNQIVAS